MLLHDIVETSRRVAEASARTAKVAALADCLRRVGPDDLPVAVALLSGRLRQGRVGLGWAALRLAMPEGAAAAPALTLREADSRFGQLAALGRGGRPQERVRLIAGLLERATAAEQDFLRRVVLGELRQGALEGLMTEALASAAGLPLPAVRRALMTQGDLGTVAEVALGAGGLALERLAIRLFRPVKPMLAQSAADTGEALRRLGRMALEHKLDGARIQVHKDGDAVQVYSRSLKPVTAGVPEVVEAVRALPAASLILDGEALGYRAGAPVPFQTTMRRFGRKLEVARARQSLELRPFFFDCLYLEGEPMVDRPAEARFAALAEALPAALLVRRILTDRPEEAAAFLAAALDSGHEGVMAKALDAGYEAGGRGGSWLKIKPAVTLDLVVLAAEWGHGRRQGWLSNLHLGARDPEGGGFVMLGKTFKGMTDEMLAWQTERLQKLASGSSGHTVQVRPELVVEIAFNEIQESPRYPGGLALRFARVKRYRTDKRAEEADTIDTVRAIHRQRLAQGAA